MSLELMKITGYLDEDFTSPASEKSYEVMLNPESLKWNRSISYNEKSAIDTSAPDQTYEKTSAESLNFDLVIDCTGIVDSKRLDLSTELKKLEDIIYTYNGKIHRPNFVKIQWGADIIFQSVLKSFDTTYTLFKPDGSPLRAKVSLSFSRYISQKSREEEDNRKSPDMTHYVQVIEGDSLPQLCNKIWNSPYYYIQVAKYNKLNKFRNLKGGKELLFPPIIKSN